jgi:hypothetical protein
MNIALNFDFSASILTCCYKYNSNVNYSGKTVSKSTIYDEKIHSEVKDP